jgi:RNA polymerase sigma-70 factor (ECF subfamily)
MSETSQSLLEQLRRPRAEGVWQRFADLYTPMLRSWLRRYEALEPADVDDLVQEVLLTVSQELPGFEHNGRPGAFRSWLRVILVNRLRHFWRSRKHRPGAMGGSDFLEQLDQLEDAGSAISQNWALEHDRQLMRRLFELIRPRFADVTWQAFRRQVIDGAPAETVAQELGIPHHSVYAAKSRVLKALRAEAEGLVG